MKRKNCNKCRACYIDYNLNRQTAYENEKRYYG